MADLAGVHRAPYSRCMWRSRCGYKGNDLSKDCGVLSELLLVTHHSEQVRGPSPGLTKNVNGLLLGNASHGNPLVVSSALLTCAARDCNLAFRTHESTFYYQSERSP
jgi:hypothetical protein